MIYQLLEPDWLFHPLSTYGNVMESQNSRWTDKVEFSKDMPKP